MAPLSAQQRQEFTEAIDLLKSNWEIPLGKTYEVNIKAEREHFLDWDKPLSEQSPEVQKALSASGIEAGKLPTGWQVIDRGEGTKSGSRFIIKDASGKSVGGSNTRAKAIENATVAAGTSGQELYNNLARHVVSSKGRGDVATMLKEAGIPGIKYLDQGSRGAKGEGTSNFVVFNDALIDIVRKYGIAAIAAIPPALALKNEATGDRQ